MQAVMNIVVSTDRNYLKYLRVLMVSAFENHPNIKVDFYVLHSELNEDDRLYLQEVADMYGQVVNLVYVDPAPYECLVSSKRWPTNAFYDLAPNLYLPKNLDRALYLDIDMVVDGDLTELYNQPLDDCYIIASPEFFNILREPKNPFETFKKEPDFDDRRAGKGELLNSGMLLYNLKAMRDNNIDINYYYSKVKGLDYVFFDQGTICVALKKHIKLLTTCKYNYRIAYSLIGYYDRANFHLNQTRKYKFVPLDAKIYHYCGTVMYFKPWDYYFNKNELNLCDLLNIIPEGYEYIAKWWKYAAKVPDYNVLYANMQVNKTVFKGIKKFLIDRNIEFCNVSGLATLNVPKWWDFNDIKENEDLNTFTLPRIYRCIDFKTKETIKNLPKSFVQKYGFRLTVKNIAANGGEDTAIIQILEPNEPTAPIYRRYGKMRGGNTFGKWQKVIMMSDDDVSSVTANQAIPLNIEFKALQDTVCYLQKQVEEVQAVINSRTYKLSKLMTAIPRRLKRKSQLKKQKKLERKKKREENKKNSKKDS